MAVNWYIRDGILDGVALLIYKSTVSRQNYITRFLGKIEFIIAIDR